jgi:GxxExxY protein
MTEHEPIPEGTEDVASSVVEAAFRAHRAFGPGLLESVYEACMCHELGKLGVEFARQVNLPVRCDGMRLDSGLHLDLYVPERVIVELKAVGELTSLHRAQLLTHLRLARCRLGFLINFNVSKLKDGIVPLVL